MTTPLTQPIPKKSKVLAFLLGLVFGPLGFFYLGWRCGLAAIGFFLVYVGTMAIPWFGDVLAMAAPPKFWGMLHCIVVGVWALLVVEDHNTAIAKGDSAAFAESKGMEFATEMALGCYKLLQIITFALAGIIIAFKLVCDGRIGVALLTLFFAVPVAAGFAGFIYWVFSFLLVAVCTLAKMTWERLTGKTDYDIDSRSSDHPSHLTERDAPPTH